MNKTKTTTRKELIKLRSTLSKEEREDKSDIVSTQIKSLDKLKEAKVVSIYVSTEEEVQTNAIIKYLLEQNKRVVIPYMENKIMSMKEIKKHDFESEVVMGIKQPKASAKTIPFEDVDFTFLPCTGFDENLNRIGYGLGCYDTFLQQSKTYKCLLAFEIQKLDKVPTEKHDQKMDVIIYA